MNIIIYQKTKFLFSRKEFSVRMFMKKMIEENIVEILKSFLSFRNGYTTVLH